ncbi:metallophosphoesterase [Sphingobacterium sp. SGG-5]|uniref:calcineurin-like phosphoesterase C-terminal domain-containing protein n=1 Tax=Sphingobacterium sp. SGG-5 TaxID=2710881 RepID=UPI0013EB9A52|nr:calcineurin-like phosphoesterase family protein [Sphingobacterium sp. SGG-5]NGM61576.1 metallophosphoesterase [Sphingobacterium sp. SGG-5]
MKYRHLFLYIFALLLFSSGVSCSKSTSPDVGDSTPPPKEEPATLRITDISIPTIYDRNLTTEVKIKGKGFKTGDIIVFNSIDNPSVSVNTTPTSIEADYITVRVPSGVPDGSRYRLIARRGNESQVLGATVFNTVLRTDIPDQQGKSIKGVVHVGGVGLADVVVSDGYDVTKTDHDGVYYLSSNKRTGYVFVSIPGNYEIKERNGNLPKFYKYLHGTPEIVETVDFELTATNNENHVVLSMADFHLANRNDDLAQYRTGFLTDINGVIASYKAAGKKVYGLTLGDLTWDLYWYSRNFSIPQYVTEINRVDDIHIFNVIGNHDNDPYFTNDWLSENPFRNILGPTYYSFNLGKVHYIVLDDTEWINTGGGSGVIGDRNYKGKVTDDQMAWLAKDLATVESSTPIVLATHIQLNNAPPSNGSTPGYRLDNGPELVSALSRFNEVHVLTGHTHVNYKVERNSGKIMEHNTAAVCGTWWWTGTSGGAGNQIAPDGSPTGYGVWEMNGTDIKWFYKSIGHEKDYQFRSYDLNSVLVSKTAHAPNANSTYTAMIPSYSFGFDSPNTNNEVLINVWGYDPQWTVSVTEEGKPTPLTVTRLNSRDPLHIISYAMKRLNVNATPTFDSNNTSHMFKVKASAPNTTLNIQVTDRFGRVYTETMTRPKAFTYSMK